MNVWIVRLDWGNHECYVNWTWKRLVIMFIGSSYYIFLRDVDLGRNGGIDRALYFYGAVFHSY